MKNKPPAWLRWPAICLLSIAFIAVFPVAWTLQRATGATLWIAEAIKAALDTLTDGAVS